MDFGGFPSQLHIDKIPFHDSDLTAHKKDQVRDSGSDPCKLTLSGETTQDYVLLAMVSGFLFKHEG